MPKANRRAATASIRGYLYQTVLAAQAWLDLEPGETLVVEGDEDFDRILRGERVSTQVKHRTDEVVTLRSESLRKSLRAFAETFVARDGAVKFVYVTTQSRRPPVGQGDHVGNWAKTQALDVVAAELADVAAKHKWKQVPSEWLAFVRSVRLEFDQDDLGKARGDLVDRLERLDVADAKGLAARLLDALWEASSDDRIELRTKTKAQLDALIEEPKAALASWLRSDAAKYLVGWVHAAVDLEEAFAKVKRRLKDPDQPSQLLDARYRVIPFLENLRRGPLEDFEMWFESEPRVAVRVVVGSGGTGKTRLFMELCERRAGVGWHAGFLRIGASEAETAKHAAQVGTGRGARLIVVDYAETRLDVTQAVLEAVDRSEARCRVVLLAREPGPWLDTLRTGDAVVKELMPESAIRLPPLSPKSGADREAAFREMVRSFAIARSVAVPEPLPNASLDEPAMGNALMLAMAALEATREKREESLRPERLLDATLEHERRFWSGWCRKRCGINKLSKRQKDTLDEAVAAMTLLGSVESVGDAEEVVERLFEARASRPGLDLVQVVDLLLDLYGDGGQAVAGLRPDLLGEHLVFRVLSARGDTVRWLDATLRPGDDEGVANAFTVLGRMGFQVEDADRRRAIEEWIRDALTNEFSSRALAAYRAAVALGSWSSSASVGRILAEQLDKVEAVSARSASKAILQELDQLNPTPVSLRELGVSCGRIRVEALCGDPDAKAELAGALNNLGARHSALGDREAALDATQQAVDHYRQLANDRPDAFLPDLAGALNNLGNRHSELGDREAALGATQQAVGHYRQLAKDRPDAFLPYLAGALNNLGIRHSALGDREAALGATQQAVGHYHQLANDRPDAFLPDLAMSLNNLGSMHSALGDREAALDATQQAVDIRRQLAKDRPDAFLPNLAASLNNLGTMHSALGDREAALDATQQAVDHYCQLAKDRPDAFLPDLAASLNNLGMIQSALGDREAALDATQQAVGHYRQLAKDRPAAFLPELARSLDTTGFVLLAADRPAEAIPSLEEGLRILLPLAERLPEAHRQYTPSLAKRLVSAAKAAGVDPDPDLLDQVRKIYGDDAA